MLFRRCDLPLLLLRHSRRGFASRRCSLEAAAGAAPAPASAACCCCCSEAVVAAEGSAEDDGSLATEVGWGVRRRRGR
eukprot:1618983-Pleurochrysis_carterae.AAC.1